MESSQALSAGVPPLTFVRLPSRSCATPGRFLSDSSRFQPRHERAVHLNGQRYSVPFLDEPESLHHLTIDAKRGQLFRRHPMSDLIL